MHSASSADLPPIRFFTPTSGEMIEWFEELPAADLDRALDDAVAAQKGWALTPIRDWVELLTSIAAGLWGRSVEYASLTTEELRNSIVEAPMAEEFVGRFVDVDRLVIDDLAKRSIQIRPMARADLRETIERQVRQLASLGGARVLTGGTRRVRTGYFFSLMVLAGVTPEMPSFREETLCLATAIMEVQSADEAVASANASPNGLGASLWTRDINRARSIVRRVEAGSVFINASVASDPRHEEIGLWARAGNPRDSRIHQRQDSLDRAGGDARTEAAIGINRAQG